MNLRMSESKSDAFTTWRHPNMEPLTRIELAFSAWEADVLPLNYRGMRRARPYRHGGDERNGASMRGPMELVDGLEPPT